MYYTYDLTVISTRQHYDRYFLHLTPLWSSHFLSVNKKTLDLTVVVNVLANVRAMCSAAADPGDAGACAADTDPSCLQEHETEYNLATMMENSKVMKADPSQFELLKVLGQGSFGKVSKLPNSTFLPA